jgi:formate/nitrite transporter FocA (FNT family)
MTDDMYTQLAGGGSGPTASPSGGEITTERKEERGREDRQYVPVIIKRNDEAKRHPDDVLEVAIEEGCEQLNRPTISLALSSIAAGLILGFTAMAVGVVMTAVQDIPTTVVQRIAVAAAYPLGFVVCLMSGAELFTEHTATAVYPVLDGRKRIRSLLRLWIVVVCGNLIGAAIGALLLNLAEDVIQAREGYIAIASHAIHVETFPLLISSMLAGWLMALGAWLILATPPDFSQIVCIYIVTFLIGLGGLHHSIAGTAEVIVGVLVGDEIGVGASARFVGLALVGNLIGGSVFVAALNYAHIRRTRAVE